jgi:hypothetical protein
MIKYNLNFLSDKLSHFIDFSDLNSNGIHLDVNW